MITQLITYDTTITHQQKINSYDGLTLAAGCLMSKFCKVAYSSKPPGFMLWRHYQCIYSAVDDRTIKFEVAPTLRYNFSGWLASKSSVRFPVLKNTRHPKLRRHRIRRFEQQSQTCETRGINLAMP